MMLTLTSPTIPPVPGSEGPLSSTSQMMMSPTLPPDRCPEHPVLGGGYTCTNNILTYNLGV